MSRINDLAIRGWRRIGTRLLPFSDAASSELPLPRLLRLSLFQVSVGMAMVLLAGTLNRVMIVELGVPASVVAIMIALPVLFAPMRALVGFKSDVHRSAIGWRRVPYIWFGSLMMFGGLAIMPFAVLLLGADSPNRTAGMIGAAAAFLITGAGIHTTQTSGLALASDLSPEDKRPRVFAFLYVMLLVGMVAAALTYGLALDNFSNTRLVQVIQSTALLAITLNCIALWKQEARRPNRPAEEDDNFVAGWSRYSAVPGSVRLLVATAVGTASFAMQDVLLEPYGGAILKLSVSQTTDLTALTAMGALIGLAIAATALTRGMNACRLAALGALIGIPALTAVSLAAPVDSALLFRAGAALMGLGGGLFTIGTLTASVRLPHGGGAGLAVGAWGAAQATAAGAGLALGGALRDWFAALAASGSLGSALSTPWASYSFVYQIEVIGLFVTLAVIGPLVRQAWASGSPSASFGFAEFPG